MGQRGRRTGIKLRCGEDSNTAARRQSPIQNSRRTQTVSIQGQFRREHRPVNRSPRWYPLRLVVPVCTSNFDRASRSLAHSSMDTPPRQRPGLPLPRRSTMLSSVRSCPAVYPGRQPAGNGSRGGTANWTGRLVVSATSLTAPLMRQNAVDKRSGSLRNCRPAGANRGDLLLPQPGTTPQNLTIK